MEGERPAAVIAAINVVATVVGVGVGVPLLPTVVGVNTTGL